MECSDAVYLTRAILNTVVTFFGVGGNVLTSFVILLKMRRNVLNALLVSLAIVNSVYLLCTCLLRILSSLENYGYLYQISVILVKLTFFIAEWTLVLLCLCRYNAYRHPRYVDRIWKPCNLAVMLSVICLTSFMANFTHIKAAHDNIRKYNNDSNSIDNTRKLPLISRMGIFNHTTPMDILQNDVTDSKTSTWSYDGYFYNNRYNLVYHIVIIGIIPAAIMLYCSIVMYHQSKSYSNIESGLSYRDPTKDLMKKTDDCSKIVLVLVTVFLVGLILFIVTFIERSVRKFIGVKDNCFTTVSTQITFSLLEISASMEFYVFLILRTEFRVKVLEMLCCKK